MTRVLPHIRVVAVAAFVAVALLPAGATSRRSALAAPSQPDRKFNIAVVRADGVLTPFGQFDRGNWRPLWTGLERSWPIAVPLTLDDIDRDWWRREPPSLDWTLWRGQDPPLPLRVTAPRVVATPCGTQVALGTDFKPSERLPPPQEAPYPKAGLATTAAADIEPIPEVERGSEDWQRVLAALDEKEFPAAEGRALSGMQWRHPVPPSVRARTPLDLQALWHVKDSRFFYFEAMRRYPDPNPPRDKPPCELVTYVAGYLWEDGSTRLRPARVDAVVTYCHLEPAMFLWPFGVIREGGKHFWVFQSAGWTAEIYGVSEPVPAKGTVKAHLWHVAGRCR